MRNTFRLIFLSLLLILIAAASYWLFFTNQGNQYLDRENLRHLGMHLHNWVGKHPVTAVSSFIGLYILLAILCLPLWWLQIVGGYGFGLYLGVACAQIGASIAAALTVSLSHELIGDWFEKKIESRRAKLHEIDAKLGHNGFLVVMAIRLMHIIPFGLSNYAFGLIRIRPFSAAIGTLLGNIPAVAFYCAIGAGYHPWNNWRFDTALVSINLFLLLPLGLRYIFPGWFEKIGVE